MNYNKQTVKDVPLSGKKVLLRCDFNVPQDKTTGEITSDKRIVAALPTIRYLLDHGAAVIACSHLGKPKGTWKESLTLAPVAKRLTELLGMDVLFAKDIVGEDAKTKAAALQPGQLLLQVLVIVRPQVGKVDLRCHFVILTFVDSIFYDTTFPPFVLYSFHRKEVPPCASCPIPSSPRSPAAPPRNCCAACGTSPAAC